MPIRMILVLMLSLLVPPAFGQTYDDMDIAELRMRAEQEDVIAQSQLGYRYRIGQGVLQDYILAHMWMNLSASNSTGALRDDIGKRRDTLAEKMPPEAIIEAQKLAREWKPKSSHNGRDFRWVWDFLWGLFDEK